METAGEHQKGKGGKETERKEDVDKGGGTILIALKEGHDCKLLFVQVNSKTSAVIKWIKCMFDRFGSNNPIISLLYIIQIP